jgi:hypothetical protein
MSSWNEDGYDTPSKRELREDRAKEFNEKQRFLTRAIGENMASIGAILIVMFFVGYIWTDIQLRLSWEAAVIDGAVTVAFLVFLESMCTQNGVKGGKLDDVYVKTHEAYLELRGRVTRRGLCGMASFCEKQIDEEYESYMRRRCKQLKIEYTDYCEKYRACSLRELKKIFPAKKAVEIFNLKDIDPIELTPDMLMTDGSAGAKKRGGVSRSAEEYIKRQNYGFWNLIFTAASGFLSAGIAFYVNDGASWGLVMYTLMKLVLAAKKAIGGYSKGAKAYNSVEVTHMQDKMLYLNLYLESLGEKEENKPS